MRSPKFENSHQNGQTRHHSSVVTNMQPFEQEDESLVHL